MHKTRYRPHAFANYKSAFGFSEVTPHRGVFLLLVLAERVVCVVHRDLLASIALFQSSTSFGVKVRACSYSIFGYIFGRMYSTYPMVPATAHAAMPCFESSQILSTSSRSSRLRGSFSGREDMRRRPTRRNVAITSTVPLHSCKKRSLAKARRRLETRRLDYPVKAKLENLFHNSNLSAMRALDIASA